MYINSADEMLSKSIGINRKYIFIYYVTYLSKYVLMALKIIFIILLLVKN